MKPPRDDVWRRASLLEIVLHLVVSLNVGLNNEFCISCIFQKLALRKQKLFFFLKLQFNLLNLNYKIHFFSAKRA